MKKSLMLLATSALFATCFSLGSAGAMTAAHQSELTNGGLLEKAAVICGYRGCVRTYRPYGYYRRPYYGYGYGYWRRPYYRRWGWY